MLGAGFCAETPGLGGVGGFQLQLSRCRRWVSGPRSPVWLSGMPVPLPGLEGISSKSKASLCSANFWEIKIWFYCMRGVRGGFPRIAKLFWRGWEASCEQRHFHVRVDLLLLSALCK